MSSPGKDYWGINPIRSPSFCLSVLVSAQQSAFAISVLSDLYAFHCSTGNSLCPYPLGFDNGLKKPPIDALRPIILDNVCILCITMAAGTELADAYCLDTVIASSPGKEVHNPMADHPFELATNHRLAYEVLAAISSYCSPPKGKFLRVTHPSTTGNTTSRLTCMC
ncbi:hypothetical protein RGQ29_020323 [Quercus rubra]|uniref:Uncharacterized protein n=1 Tax=Quercus rubra TaxID=3512 RepID=A0AAN7FEW1_QUERU|nr:hypothetical protein RGQ29_020323 [Quercus rubra]